jgi:hypothetical protein
MPTILGKSYVNLIMSSNIVSDKLEGLNAKIAKLDPSFTFAKVSNINCYLQGLSNTVLNDYRHHDTAKWLNCDTKPNIFASC